MHLPIDKIKYLILSKKVVELLNIKADRYASLLWEKWNFVLDIFLWKWTEILRPNMDLGRLNVFFFFFSVSCDFLFVNWLGKRTFNIVVNKISPRE